MTVQLSTTDSLLVAIPMVGLDENGHPICLDPDGQVVERKSKKN